MPLSLSLIVSFQFPSNGKAYPKHDWKGYFCQHNGEVSIPFKRESISKDRHSQRPCLNNAFCFNSLQTGKHIQSHSDHAVLIHKEAVFQFPSNGKAYPKVACLDRPVIRYISFNSLQTGKHIQRDQRRGQGGRQSRIRFQFPSNGKAYPKLKQPLKRKPKLRVSIPFKRESISKGIRRAEHSEDNADGFNSLQTGKHIQRSNRGKCQDKKGFNSLQTGKHIQSCSLSLRRQGRHKW